LLYRFLEAENSGRVVTLPPRVIYTNFYFQNSPAFYEALVDISAGRVIWQRNLGTQAHAPGTPEEMERIHAVAMSSELVQSEIKRLKLAAGADVICEPWPYGKDGVDDGVRLFQVQSVTCKAKFCVVLLLSCFCRPK
jgi:primary-amine oxidase